MPTTTNAKVAINGDAYTEVAAADEVFVLTFSAKDGGVLIAYADTQPTADSQVGHHLHNNAIRWDSNAAKSKCWIKCYRKGATGHYVKSYDS